MNVAEYAWFVIMNVANMHKSVYISWVQLARNTNQYTTFVLTCHSITSDVNLII